MESQIFSFFKPIVLFYTNVAALVRCQDSIYIYMIRGSNGLRYFKRPAMADSQLDP